MGDIVLSADALMVPRVKGEPIVFDMREIYRAEGRLVELQGITRLKAGELTHCYIVAWGKATEYAVRAKAELLRAKAAMREAQAIVVLDRAADVLKAKGLASSRSPAGSADLRSAVVERDEDYKFAEERVIQITAVAEMLEKHANTFKMAYFAIERTLGPVKREVSGDTGTDDIGALTDGEKTDAFVRQHAVRNPASYTQHGFGVPKL